MQARRFLVSATVLGLTFGADVPFLSRTGASFSPTGVVAAQDTASGGDQQLVPRHSKAVKFGKSVPIRTLKPRAAVVRSEARSKLREIPIRPARREKQKAGRPGPSREALQQVDTVVQTSIPELAAPAPLLSFEGLSNIDNFNVFGFRVLPPDTNGDVGPAHYVQTTNLLFRVFSKTGTALTAPLGQSSLFTGFEGPCEVSDDGDPIVLYDHLADRWLISQFAVTGPPFHQCVAISQTGDPTGAYYLYDFVMVNDKFNDYPHFGVWPDGYYMTDNQFGDLGFAGGGVFAFDRAKMLVGDPNAGFIYFDLEPLDPFIGGMLPSDLDGPPPAAGTPNYFAFFTADEDGLPPPDNLDALRIFKFHADFATPGNSTFIESGDSPLAVAPFEYSSPAGRDDIPQPGSTASTMLDSISDRLMHRLQYRNFGTYESLVVNHTVDVDPSPAYHAGVRYYQVRRNLPAGSLSVAEQASFAPDAAHRWMGSAAMDQKGDLAVGYSVSSATIFPSIRYAGRLSTDVPNGLFQGEATLKAGTGAQTSTSSRWGDYSMLAVDPVDDCTFWYTTEFYKTTNEACPTSASTACWHTQIGKFKFPACLGVVSRGTLKGTVKDAATGLPVAGALVMTTNGWSRATSGTGAYSMTTPPGTYTVTASAAGYASATVSGVVVVTGGITTRNFVLTPKPVLTREGFDVTGGNGNGAIDFNECTNLSLTLVNSGFAAATGVSGVLSTSTPDVTITQANSTYPDIAVGGSELNDSAFKLSTAPTFVAGTAIDVTLEVSTNQGSFTLKGQLPTGTGPSAPATFTSAAPVAIPDNVPAGVDSPISVAGITNALNNVTVTLYITHTWDADLSISLVGPDATTVSLASDVGFASTNFGTDCPADGNDTTFDDAAVTPIGSGTAPFVGTFRPQGSLATFKGKAGADVNGTWNLHVADRFGGADVGNIECWSITISGTDSTDGGGVCSTANSDPVADAGTDQAVDEGAPLTLDATASSDADGNPLAFSWSQLSGPPVTLVGGSTATPAFIAPFVGSSAVLEFQVTASDTLGTPSTDTVLITVTSTGASVRGTVTAGGPVRGAQVIMTGPVTRSAFTDANGYYQFGGLPAGRYNMVARKLGIGQRAITVTLATGQDRTINISLVGP